MGATNANVIEATDANFGEVVLEESFKRPVVVDFWAEWCQPCRMIGPVLERLAEEHGGDFLLAKLDTDSNPQAATAFRIQGIPAVKAFRDGKLVSEFVGAIPERAIRQWLEPLLPSEATGLVEQAGQAEREGRPEEADRLYRQVLTSDPNHVGAALGAGRVATERGQLDEARRLLQPLRPDPEAERLLDAIEVSEWASPDGSGPLAEAERAAAEGRYQEALDTFLAAVQNGSEQDRRQAREAMLKVLSVLGEEHPLTAEYRRKLAAALF
jgi:putative thioredoxin